MKRRNDIGLTDGQCELLFRKIHEVDKKLEELFNDFHEKNRICWKHKSLNCWQNPEKCGNQSNYLSVFRTTQYYRLKEINRMMSDLKSLVLKPDQQLEDVNR